MPSKVARKAALLTTTGAATVLPSANTTPLAWSRGLQPDGSWSKRLGLYGDWGGHIVFANGSLMTFIGSINGKLKKFGTSQPTSDIREALPPGTRISEFKPTK
jgi:hypothetical protein